jgi:hypothetical protein
MAMPSAWRTQGSDGTCLASGVCLVSLRLADTDAAFIPAFLALVATGAALFFLDGGATQKALEAGAVQQVANEEGALMEDAPLLPYASVSASSFSSDPSSPVASLSEEGVVFVKGLLDEPAATELRRYVEAWLLQAKKEAEEDTAPEQRFGGVLSRTNRWAACPVLLALPTPASCVHAPYLCPTCPCSATLALPICALPSRVLPTPALLSHPLARRPGPEGQRAI